MVQAPTKRLVTEAALLEALADIETSITPEKHGAVGDGSDETAKLQAAIDEAAVHGGVVELKSGKTYGWSGILTVKSGVFLIGQATRQNLAQDAAPTMAGLVALTANSQLRVGDWAGGNTPAGASDLYVDGNFIGGDNAAVAKKGLVRYAGVNVLDHNVFVVRSAGLGKVYDGMQNSTILGGTSTQNKGAALGLDNGAGALEFVGGYYGNSKGGALESLDTVGETNMYPFGPTQVTFTGTIFEAYGSLAAPLDGQFAHHMHVSGTSIKFDHCNFTGGADNADQATVLIDSTTTSFIPPTAIFDSCIWWVHEGHDAVRVLGNAALSFMGQQSVGDDGTHHAVSFICVDGGSPHIAMQGEVILAGDTFGTKMFRTVNGGTLNGVYKTTDGGEIYRMSSANQVVSVRRVGDTGPRMQITRDGVLAWFDGLGGATRSYIQPGLAGAGPGIEFYTASGGIFNFLGGAIRVPAIYFGNDSTPFDPAAAGGGGATKDLLAEWFNGADGGEVTSSKCVVSATTNAFDGYVSSGAKLYQPNQMYSIAEVSWNDLTLSPYGSSFLNKSKANAVGSTFDFTTMFEGQYMNVTNTKIAGIAQDVRIWIDDQEVTEWYLGDRSTGTLQNKQTIPFTVDTAFGVVNLNFKRRGIYKVRVAGICVGGASALLACNAEGRFYKPKKQRVLGIISDSWYDLIPGNTSILTGSELAAKMGWIAWNMANGGSGFMNPASGGLTYGGDTVFASLAKAPTLDLLLLNGSSNDLGYSDASVVAAMQAFFTRWRTVRPDVPIVWKGLESQSYFRSTYPQATIAAREALLTATALADASVLGVIQPATETWLTGTGKVGTPVGDGNQDFVTGADGIHSSIFGAIFDGTLTHQRLGAIPVKKAA